jgi:hypothetical protein
MSHPLSVGRVGSDKVFYRSLFPSALSRTWLPVFAQLFSRTDVGPFGITGQCRCGRNVSEISWTLALRCGRAAPSSRERNDSLIGPESKPGRARADCVGSIAWRKVAVVLFNHPRVGCPRFFAATSNGTPFMTACEAHVCRKPWKPIGGLILACSQASAIGRSCSDSRHWPLSSSVLTFRPVLAQK